MVAVGGLLRVEAAKAALGQVRNPDPSGVAKQGRVAGLAQASGRSVSVGAANEVALQPLVRQRGALGAVSGPVDMPQEAARLLKPRSLRVAVQAGLGLGGLRAPAPGGTRAELPDSMPTLATPAHRLALAGMLRPVAAPPPGASGCWVDAVPSDFPRAQMQRLLLLAGFDPGPVDGKLGRRSIRAVLLALGPGQDPAATQEVIRRLNEKLCAERLAVAQPKARPALPSVRPGS